MALTEKQKRFALYYIQDPNATKAAKAAGYSDDTAYSQGQRLLKHVEIRAYIQKKLDTIEITSQRILAETAKVAFADMGDYAKVQRGGEVTVTPFEKLEPGATRAIKKLKEKRRILSGEDGDTILDQQTEFELHDKLKALETLAKIRGMLKDQVQISGNPSAEPVRVEYVRPDQ